MKKVSFPLFCVFISLFSSSYVSAQRADLTYCQKQVARTLVALCDADGRIDFTRTPRSVSPGATHWTLRNVKTPEEWTSGFFPGILWMTAESMAASDKRRASVIEAAKGFTCELEYLAHRPVYDHDLGFIMIGSFLKGYQLTGDTHYRDVLLAAADTLATLFNPRVGTMLSWPRNVAMFGGHHTIMDNMINLELLTWAARQHVGADGKMDAHGQRLLNMACAHADTTFAYQFREDYTLHHVAVYNAATGQHIRNCNHQGYDNHSVWSRGQAWAIYGYTMMYRETQQPRFLVCAQKVTDVFLRMLPEDGIPYWDMCDVSIPHTYRDASSACIIASALIELGQYVGTVKSDYYLSMARRILRTLASKAYRSGNRCPAFLLHSTGNWPSNSELDCSINYADYYYLEALLRLQALSAK